MGARDIGGQAGSASAQEMEYESRQAGGAGVRPLGSCSGAAIGKLSRGWARDGGLGGATLAAPPRIHGGAGFSTWPCSSPGGLPGRTRAAFGRGTSNSKRTISPHVASQHEAAWSRPHDDGLPNGSASRCGGGPCAHVSPVLPRAQATTSHPIIVLDMAAWPDGRRHGRRAAVPALIQTLWPMHPFRLWIFCFQLVQVHDGSAAVVPPELRARRLIRTPRVTSRLSILRASLVVWSR